MRDHDSDMLLQSCRKMLLLSAKLYSWQMDEALTLQFTNHPEDQSFYDLFLISSCSRDLVSYFAGRDNPLILLDEIGFAWIAAAKKETGQVKEYHLLGPFFFVEATEQYLIRLFSRLHLSSELARQLRLRMKKVPAITIPAALSYGVMLQYSAVGQEITPEEVSCVLSRLLPEKKIEDNWEVTGRHNSWEAEQKLFHAIRNGTLEPDLNSISTSFSGSTIGSLCPWDPLRQAKDEVLVLIVLASRAAILGGVSPEGGYSIADYYFQQVEACKTVGAVQSCGKELLETILRRVRKCRENQNRSAVIRACMDYVETHLLEKIRLEDMAKELGYASYYLSKRFKSETGMSLNTYINEQKIERSKLLLKNPGASIAEISERLGFSSPSYFAAVFKKVTGIIPSEYQNP